MTMFEIDEFELEQRRDIGMFFQKLREKENLKQKELAEEFGIGSSQVSQFENGVQDYKISTLQRWARGFGLRIEVNVYPMEEVTDEV